MASISAGRHVTNRALYTCWDGLAGKYWQYSLLIFTGIAKYQKTSQKTKISKSTFVRGVAGVMSSGGFYCFFPVLNFLYTEMNSTGRTSGIVLLLWVSNSENTSVYEINISQIYQLQNLKYKYVTNIRTTTQKLRGELHPPPRETKRVHGGSELPPYTRKLHPSNGFSISKTPPLKTKLLHPSRKMFSGYKTQFFREYTTYGLF